MFANYLFHAYDADQNGVIDFKEFLLVMSVSAKGTVVDKLRWAFKLYDLDGSGQVSRDEAIEIIQVSYLFIHYARTVNISNTIILENPDVRNTPCES